MREMRALGRLDEKSTDKIPRSLQALGLRTYADRLEAALKRKADSIHRAMVLIAGIEMEDSENPPRLWTALEDAYDALSDALGTDGETTADVEEAKATGRHFVVKPSNNAAKMREALEKIASMGEQIDNQLGSTEETVYALRHERCLAHNISECACAALDAPPRNCDRFNTPDEALCAHCEEKGITHPLPLWHGNEFWGLIQWLFAE